METEKNYMVALIFFIINHGGVMALFDKTELDSRVLKLKEMLAQKGLDAALFTYPPDLLYYAGSVQPLYLIVSTDAEPIMLARKGAGRIEKEAGHIRLALFQNTDDFSRIMKNIGLTSDKKIGICFETIRHSAFERLTKALGNPAMIDISWEIRLLRVVKSKRERALQREAAEKLTGISEILMSSFKPGMTELELTALLESYFRIEGLCINHSRQEGIDCGYGICSSGVRTTVPSKFDGICTGEGLSPAFPFGASREKIERNTPVLLDYGVTWNGYHIDITRMFSWGSPVAEVRKAYQAMVDIEEAVMECLRPGIPWKEPYELAVKLAERNGYDAEFMGAGAEKVKFIGHGVGLELDEPPFLALKMDHALQTDMVLALEPKVVLKGIGVVGIEDTVVIKEHGAEYLTRAERGIICYPSLTNT